MADSRVLEWIEKASAEMERSPLRFVSSHVDEIPGDRGRSLSENLDLLSTVAQNVLQSVHARLALPFGYSERIDVNLPDLEAVPLGSSTEPPSIYLFAADFYALPRDREEYRRPYAQTPWGDSYMAEYVCSRSLRDRALNWEYSQTVWVRRLLNMPVA